MRDYAEMRTKIYTMQKLLDLGGFIAEVAIKKMNEAVCDAYDCSPFVFKTALKEIKDKSELMTILDALKRDYSLAEFNSLLFFQLSSDISLKNITTEDKFESWFVESELRLFSEDKYSYRDIDANVIFKHYSPMVSGFLGKMSCIEKKALFYRYNKEGEIVMSLDEIANLPLFVGGKDYLKELFDEVDSEFERYSEPEKKQFIDFVTMDFKELVEKTPCEKGNKKSDSMLSQDEINWFLNSLDDESEDD
ncbi:MAG: hypothetical protein K5669_11330 [Lachnospiraceae bacterium]|nr:hypothetical protein [Lachnospiraceae bacterium]